MSTATNQRRIVALGASVILLGGAAWAAHAMLYKDVYVANTFDTPLIAKIGWMSIDVPPHSVQAIGARTGRAAITITDATGKLVDKGTIDVRSDVDVLIWNVLGLAPVYRETLYYSVPGDPQHQTEVKPFCGQSAIAIGTVDYAFEEPPKSVKERPGEKQIPITHVGVDKGAPDQCLDWLGRNKQVDKAVELATRAAAAFPLDPNVLRAASGIVAGTGRLDQGLELSRAAAALPNADVQTHRTYQDQMIMAGRRAELVDDYRKRAASQGNSADASYLLARLLPTREGLAVVERALEREPKHALGLRLRGNSLLELGQWEQADASFERLRDVDADIWHEAIPSAATARVAAGHGDDALKILEGHFSLDADDATETAVAYARIARANKLADPTALITKIAGHYWQAKGWATWCSVRAGLPITGDELAAMPSDLRVLAEATIAARRSAEDSLALIAGLPSTELMRMDGTLWALLFAEAMRTHPDEPTAHALASGCPLGETQAALLAQYVRKGSLEGELSVEMMPLDGQAALHFVRSRAADLTESERQALVDRARREDVMQGVVTRAIAAWPP